MIKTQNIIVIAGEFNQLPGIHEKFFQMNKNLSNIWLCICSVLISWFSHYVKNLLDLKLLVNFFGFFRMLKLG